MSPRKETAVSFLQLAGAGRVREAFERHVAPNFVHHNPYFKGDAESLKFGMEQSYKQFPNKVLEVKQVLEEGDLVAVHMRIQLALGQQDYAVIHIFRFEGDRIAEIWEAGQMVPENLVNENGMF